MIWSGRKRQENWGKDHSGCWGLILLLVLLGVMVMMLGLLLLIFTGGQQ